MKNLLIVYHSMTGGTRQMAIAAAAGAGQETSVRVVLKHAPECHLEDVREADAFIFATPENLGSMSGLLKDFFDRTYYPALEQLNGRPYACLICAGSDGSGAARQIARIATGWRLREAAPPLIVLTHAQSPDRILATKQIPTDELARCLELGSALSQGLALGIF